MSMVLWREGKEPTLARWVAYCAQTSGRDKLYRALQYWGKFVHYQHVQAGRAAEAKAVKNWSGMISSARKLFRVTKFVENWAKAYTQVMALQKKVSVDTVANAVKSISAGFYFWYDMFQWLHAAKVVTSADKARLDRLRAYWWIARIVSAAVAMASKVQQHQAKVTDAAKQLQKVNVESMSLSTTKGGETVVAAVAARKKALQGKVKALKFDQTLMQADFARNALDISAPLATLGWFRLHSGHAGFFCFITSIIGAHGVWNK